MTDQINQEPPAQMDPAAGYSYSTALPGLFRSLGISLLVSTYQAQRIMAFSAREDKLFMLMRLLERPTGLAVGGDRLAVVTRRQVWFFRHAGTVRDSAGHVLPYDRCFIPRHSHVTGDIAGHEAPGLVKN